MKVTSRRFWTTFSMLLIAVCMSLSTTSCSRKSGCPAEDAAMKTNKDGSFKKGKTTSGLLPPKGKKYKKH